MKSEATPVRRRRVHPAPEPQPEAEIGQELAAPSPEKQAETGQELAAPSPEKQRASLHILLNAELLESVKELADYAAEIGLIHNDPRGNVTDFINWCIQVGKERLRQHALKRRAFI